MQHRVPHVSGDTPGGEPNDWYYYYLERLCMQFLTDHFPLKRGKKTGYLHHIRELLKVVPVSLANLSSTSQATAHQPSHIAKGGKVAQEDEKGVCGNRVQPLCPAKSPQDTIRTLTHSLLWLQPRKMRTVFVTTESMHSVQWEVLQI